MHLTELENHVVMAVHVARGVTTYWLRIRGSHQSRDGTERTADTTGRPADAAPLAPHGATRRSTTADGDDVAAFRHLPDRVVECVVNTGSFRELVVGIEHEQQHVRRLARAGWRGYSDEQPVARLVERVEQPRAIQDAMGPGTG